MRYFLFFVFLFLLVQLNGQNEDLKNRQSIARNKVRNQISWDYKYIGEKPDKNGVKTSVTTYATTGDVVQVNALNPAGTVLHTEKYSYDSRGNKTEYTRNSGDGSYQKKYIYNDQNLLAEESGFDGVENFKNLYFYNAKGVMTEIRYMKGTIVQEKRVFTKDGVTTNVAVYNKTGTVTSKLVLIYDSRGNLIEESVFGMSPDPVEKKTYNYDDRKNLKEEARYKLNQMTVRNTYNYGPTGDLIEITEESPGNSRYVKKMMSYDTKGNLLEIKWRRNAKEEFNRITYQYDEKGLCTTLDTFYPATKYRVLTRYTYEYY
jgi:hypothetical protein